MRISPLEGDRMTVLSGGGKNDIFNSLMGVNKQLRPLWERRRFLQVLL